MLRCLKPKFQHYFKLVLYVILWWLCIALLYIFITSPPGGISHPSHSLTFVKLNDGQFIYYKMTDPSKVASGGKLQMNGYDRLTHSDVFISIKTTRRFHETRLSLILKTWFQQAPVQTYIFTDYEDPVYQKLTDGHIVDTQCYPQHSRKDLSCKMSYEYDMFMAGNEKWWCHFDDDNYVNIVSLVSTLSKFDWKEDIYLGRRSMSRSIMSNYKGESVKFTFATGGAGLCITRRLGEKIANWSQGQKFVDTSNELRLPDDCTLGFIITNRLGVNLTCSDLFHSHLESLQSIKEASMSDQVSFSYYTARSDYNIINLDPKTAAFNTTMDPTRILSLHCMLYPETPYCSDR